MDSLKNLIGNIPDWIQRLDELSGQIEKRQEELARLTESQSTGPARTQSMRNKGSTESLKPRDEPQAYADIPATQDASPPAAEFAPPPLRKPDVAQTPDDGGPPSSPVGTSSALRRQTNQVMAVAQAKARATVARKRNRTDSVISAEGAAPKYRTRSMLIVYYDSFVQSFFEELVKFVSASRNMMRKAKMAAKVAQIKRMAELEMPDDDEPGSGPGASSSGGADQALEPAKLEADTPLEAATDKDDDLPPLKYVSTRNMRPMGRTAGMLATGRPISYTRAATRAAYSSAAALDGGRGGGADQKPDVYDELDKGLEFVQSTSEHAAHQFLRDGDCNEEIENIQKRLRAVKEQADKEMARVEAEDPDALKEEPPKTRSYRVQSMRRESPAATSPKEPASAMEVDEGIDDMDGEVLKPVHRPTRVMRGPMR